VADSAEVGVLVQPDQARDYGMPREIDDLCRRRNCDRTVRANALYPSVTQQNRLIGARRCTGAIDQGDVSEGNERRVDREEAASPRREGWSLSGTGYSDRRRTSQRV
jgi:hypothetical protein